MLCYNVSDVGTDAELTIRLLLLGHPVWCLISLAATLFGIFVVISSFKCSGRLYKVQRGTLQNSKNHFMPPISGENSIEDEYYGWGVQNKGFTILFSYLSVYKFAEAIPEAIIRILTATDGHNGLLDTIGIFTTLIGCIMATLASIGMLILTFNRFRVRSYGICGVIIGSFLLLLPSFLTLTTVYVFRLLVQPIPLISLNLRIAFYICLIIFFIGNILMLLCICVFYEDDQENLETIFDEKVAETTSRIKEFLCCPNNDNHLGSV